ncbi:hypothetical protein [Phytoactinopolyspora halophila]|uniref:hypothetical protein n=1 Tax=Phytoactinopolyspora halophila TaxID=1981511 RepID=UPI001B8CBE45|nr:hypothetical protein [Phytoactinopolyspora halophila]
MTVVATEAMFLVAQATYDPRDGLLLATPCFPPARTVREGLGAEVDVVPLSFDDGYRLPLDMIADALTSQTRPATVVGVGSMTAVWDAVGSRNKSGWPHPIPPWSDRSACSAPPVAAVRLACPYAHHAQRGIPLVTCRRGR